jgi:protein-tyrosine phosphatase
MHTQLYDIPGTWSGRLAIMPRPRGGDWLDEEVRAWREQGIQLVVSALTKDEIEELQLGGERDLCEANGIEYMPFPIADRGVPSSLADMARLARLLERRLASGANIVFHCRQGIGRASLLAACVLAATGVEPRAAFERIHASRGCPVPDTREQTDWVVRFAQSQLMARSGG